MENVFSNTSVAISFLQKQDEDAFISPFLSGPDPRESELTPLTEEEQAQREECEKIIDEGLNEFIGVGCQLFTIKSKKLYRSTHHSFEEYCREKFNISRVHANRLINHRDIVALLESEPKGSVCIPAKETHSRELARYSRGEIVAAGRACKEITGQRQPSAEDWKAAVAKALPGKVNGSRTKATKIEAKAAPNNNAHQIVPVPSYLPKGLPLMRELYRMAQGLVENPEKDKTLKLTMWLEQYAELQENMLHLNAKEAA